MQSLRKLMNKPRPDDWAPLAKFYYADETLNDIASELDSFDGRRDPERCNGLVNKLRVAQDRVLHIIGEMLVILYPRESDRACRDFRVKFPDDIVHDTLPGQLWFGAECLAAGSNIIDHEAESDHIRPLAKELTRHLDHLRDLLKDQSLRDPSAYTATIKDSLLKFDKLFADFEYQYVSAMVPVKSVKEHDSQLDVAVLFSEVLHRAIAKNLITQDQIDYCDPSVMIAIPRLGIVWGLLYYPDGALNVEGPQENLSEMFRPFYSLLIKIRNLLQILSQNELIKVEHVLCKGESNAPEVHTGALTMSDYRANEESKKRSGWIGKPSSSNLKDILSSLSAEVVAESPSPSGEASEESSDENVEDEESVDDEEEEDSCSEQDEPLEGFPPDPKNLRQRFRSSDDLVHRLFVCIAGVADQLQTNYSSEVRKVLKMILQPSEVIPVYEVSAQMAVGPEGEEETGIEVQESLPLPAFIGVRWVPDEDCEQCTACSLPFTVVRRRHHCRNCGRIFCHRCSSHSICIPELGYDRKVRVCNLCYLHRVNPFGCVGSSTPDANPATAPPTSS
ncbi:unnamed protein product [Caenorhabditis auriculariae]|uniref:FYVE-type domain-containing protein n=1 Tax=Caenorhabditis auriculariae TaxID=2777116 RepID=A0A8S1H7L8_9PELO|nr:unnamed protein product [Caenorhabditis auriculariae]